MVFLMGFVPRKRFRLDKMECWEGRYEKGWLASLWT